MLKLIVAAESAGLFPLARNGTPVEVWRDPDGMVCARGWTVQGAHWMQLPGVATYRFQDHSPEVIAFGEGATAALVEDTFHRTVLPMALQARGAELLHASAIRTPRGVVAFCAVGQTGKSTFAWGLSLRGYPLWADDAVLFDTVGRQVQSSPLPFELHLRPASAAFFGNGSAPASEGAATSLPLAAVCVLERAAPEADGPPAQISRLSASRAFTAALTHAYCFHLHDLERKRRMVNSYLDLIERVPVLEVRFQPGFEKLPAVLDAVERAILS